MSKSITADFFTLAKEIEDSIKVNGNAVDVYEKNPPPGLTKEGAIALQEYNDVFLTECGFDVKKMEATYAAIAAKKLLKKNR